MSNVIEVQRLTKYYGGQPVVDSLDLRIPAGSIYGFLGRNGAGKSTTIKMLLGMVQPTSGRSTIFGEDSRSLRPETRGRVAYLAEGHPLYQVDDRWRVGPILTEFLSWLEPGSRGADLGSFRTASQKADQTVVERPAGPGFFGRSRWPASRSCWFSMIRLWGSMLLSGEIFSNR